MSDIDLIQQFIDIKNFDPALIINPDSIYTKPMSNQISYNYVKVKLNFKTLRGPHYFISSTSTDKSDNFEDFIVVINGTKMPFHLTENYPLFSFDTEIVFKNAEIIDYSIGLCKKTGIETNNLTPSDNFSIHDIRFIILKDPVFVSSLNDLGFFPVIDNDYSCLSMPAIELLDMVASKQWKLRVRSTNKSNYMSVFDRVDHWTTGMGISSLDADDIYGLNDWVNDFTNVCG